LGLCRKRGKNGVAIRAGVDIIHINTEGRLAWKQGLEAGLARDEDEIVLYAILPPVVAAIHDCRLHQAPTIREKKLKRRHP
jgi:hypothetical protein